MREISALTPTFAGVSYDKLSQHGSIQWPCYDQQHVGTPIMHEQQFSHGLGRFMPTAYQATTERCNKRFPLILTTGRILSQHNVGAQTRRTANSTWHAEDVLEIHSSDAEERGIRSGDWVGIRSRIGETALRAAISERVQPSVVYTTFHHPVSGANVITTDNADWATSCPEYKVTAVEVTAVVKPSAWQQRQRETDDLQKRLLPEAPV